MEQTINKKNVFYWSLYGFAKDIVIITFALYFSEWLVVENHVADIWYNLIFVGASVLLLFTAPILAILADKKNQALPYLRIMAVFLFVTTLAASLFAVFDYNMPKFVLFAALAFLLCNYFYQFSLIFYNGFLNQLAPQNKRGLISGIGYTSNWLGEIAGLFIALPFTTGVLYWFGHAGRAQTFVPATLLFGLLALPMLFLFKETKKPVVASLNIKQEYRDLTAKFIRLCETPGVGRFLLGYFVFNDAIITLENNFAIYLQQVYHISDSLKTYILLALLIASTIGAFICGWISDKVGLKKTLLITLASILIILPALALTYNFTLLFALTTILGLAYGSVWVASRAVLAFLAPPSELNHAFSYYTLMERFATFIGPMAWGLALFLFRQHQIFSYRFAIILMAAFAALGTFIIRKIPSDKDKIVSA